jgi:AcrR family transcriptional regulator
LKDKIINKATDMFLKLGFKSVTMDDIACEMCISKKTIYKFFSNKESLIEEGTEVMHQNIHTTIDGIISKNYNAIEENFEIVKMMKDTFKTYEASPVYQLKKHYPEIYQKLLANELEDCTDLFSQNIKKGILQGLYRENIDIQSFVKFYYTIIFAIKESTQLESESLKLELQALEYHTRALATPKGITELEKQLQNYNH